MEAKDKVTATELETVLSEFENEVIVADKHTEDCPLCQFHKYVDDHQDLFQRLGSLLSVASSHDDHLTPSEYHRLLLPFLIGLRIGRRQATLELMEKGAAA